MILSNYKVNKIHEQQFCPIQHQQRKDKLLTKRELSDIKKVFKNKNLSEVEVAAGLHISRRTAFNTDADSTGQE